MNNLSSYCGLVDAKIRASEKDLPVRQCNKTKVDVLGLKVDTVKIAHCFSVKSMGQERHLEMPIFHHKILPINQTETERKLLAMNCHHHSMKKNQMNFF